MLLSLLPASVFLQEDDQNAPQTLLNEAAILLHHQWPSGGSVSDYVGKMMPTGSGKGHPSLPLSYLLVEDHDNKPGVVGHGRLTECCEMEGSGKAVAATYIIIHPDHRGHGHGTTLMQALEAAARDLGYHYMYLWTTTAVPFYQKLGYRTTCRVSLNSACLKTLESEQVGRLESMLALRHHGKPAETVLLPPGAGPTDKDVWLRKRLLECLPTFESMRLEQRLVELEHYIRTKRNSQQQHHKWRYLLHSDIPWQSQVGPSCGLTALRMLAEWSNAGESSSKRERLPSLLTEAQKRGYTLDGEMFDVRNLQSLATIYCGLRTAKLCRTEDLTLQSLADALQNNSPVILSYDSQPSSKLPCQAGGLHAHYGICVGILFGYDESLDDTIEQKQQDIVLSTMEASEVGNPSSAFLLVQQSLSPKLVIASYDEFMASNDQLRDMDATKYPKPQTMNLRGWSLICER